MPNSSRMLIGWREWVCLPGLKLPAIKAKVDTGAKTSALHAFEQQIFERHGKKHIRFRIHPLQGRSDILITCEAEVIDYRSVTDSGGHREHRYVILSDLELGGMRFPIELTLANRETMSHRMLLGRSAMKHLMIDPNHTYMLGRPSKASRLYLPHGTRAKRSKPKTGKSE